MELKDLNKDIPVGKKSEQYAELVNRLYSDLKEHYLKLHRDWYINERFLRWDHWIVFNKSLNKIQNIPSSKGEVRRTVNKIRTQVRGIKNFIKRSQPRWVVQPEDASDESLQEAVKLNKILQNVYDTRWFKKLLTEQITNSLKYSVGIIEGGIINKGNSRYLDFWSNDTFDVFIDPLAADKKDARFVIKAFKKSITSINWNKKYKFEWKIKWDWRQWASDYKDIMEKERFNTDSGKWSEDLKTTIVKELWYKYNNNSRPVVLKVTVIESQVVLVEETPYTIIPQFLFNPELEQGKIYSDAWIKDLISINKSLDKITSQTESYIQRMLAGKFLIKQWVDVSTITDEWAEKIYYKWQVPPRQLDLQPLPNIVMQHSQSLERWIEEFWGLREASLGRAPWSLQSGKWLEALQSADAQTVAEPIENLELMLAEVWEFILEVISKTAITTQKFVDWNDDIKYIGNFDFAKEQAKTDSDLIVVKPRKVAVRIVPEISYTESAKKETVMQLAQAGIIDQKTLLDYLNVSNVSDIIERTKLASEESFKQDMVKQKESHRSEWDSPNDSASLADQENTMMASGQDVPATPKALWVPEHLELHQAFIKENIDAYQQNKEMYDVHISNELNY